MREQWSTIGKSTSGGTGEVRTRSEDLCAKRSLQIFLESVVQAALFKSEIRSAVSNQLPSVVENNADRLVRPYVNVAVRDVLPDLLKSNHQVQRAFEEQKRAFDEATAHQKTHFASAFTSQRKTFDDKLKTHVQTLAEASDRLVASRVNEVLDDSAVVARINNNLNDRLESKVRGFDNALHSLNATTAGNAEKCEQLQSQNAALKSENATLQKQLHTVKLQTNLHSILLLAGLAATAMFGISKTK